MLFDMFPEFDRPVDALFSALAGGGARQAPMNVRREADRYVLEAELPGYEPDAIDVSVDHGWLTIQAQRSDAHETKDARWVVRERSESRVARRFPLGDDVDPEAISADYRNGVLQLTLPIKADAKPHRIQVSSGQMSGRRSIGATTAAATGESADGQTAQTGRAQDAQDAGAEGKAEPAHSLAS